MASGEAVRRRTLAGVVLPLVAALAVLVLVPVARADEGLPGFEDLATSATPQASPSFSPPESSSRPPEAMIFPVSLDDATPAQAAALYALLEKLQAAVTANANLEPLRKDVVPRLERSWNDEVGCAVPSMERMRRDSSPWYGFTGKTTRSAQALVTGFLRLVETDRAALGPLADRLVAMVTADVVDETRDRFEASQRDDDSWPSNRETFDGKPDWKDSSCSVTAALRLLLLSSHRDRLLLEGSDSPLAEAVAVPASLSRVYEPGTPWTTVTDAPDSGLEQTRSALARALNLPLAQVVPGPALYGALRSELARRLARGDTAGHRELSTAARAFASAGTVAWTSSLEPSTPTTPSAPTTFAATDGATEVSIKPEPSTQIARRVRREILEADLDADVKLFDTDVFDGLSVSAKYKWSIEPSYRSGFHTRIDRWIVKSELRVGDLIEGLAEPLPVYLNFSAGAEIIFARQFQNKLKSAAALPYTPLKIPFTAKKALGLAPGDFVSLPVDLRAVTGLSLGSELIPGVGWLGAAGSAGMTWVVAGGSRVNVLRLEDDLVRVRITALRDRSRAVSAGIKLDFELLGVSLLDNGIGSIVGRKLLGTEAAKYTNELFTWDFLFDLRDGEAGLAARKAYEAIMAASVKLRSLRGGKPFTRASDLSEFFVNDLRPAEELAAREDSGVTRLFKGSNLSHGSRRQFKLGFNGMSFEKKRMWGANRLFDDQGAASKRYLMPISSARSGWRLFFGWSKEETERTNYAILEADAAWRPCGAAKLVSSLSIADKRVSRGEAENYAALVTASLGDDLVHRLGPLEWARKATRGLRVNLSVAMTRSLFDRVFSSAADDEDQLWQCLAAVAEAFPPPSSTATDDNRFDVRPSGYGSWPAARRSAADRMADAVGRDQVVDWSAVEKTAAAIRRARRCDDRARAADELVTLSRSSSWMRGAFIRLVVELARPVDLSGLYVHLDARGEGFDAMDADLGEDELADLYDVVQEITYNVNDNSYGMR